MAVLAPGLPLEIAGGALRGREQYGTPRKLRGTLFGVLKTRIPLFRVLCWGPLFSETPILQWLRLAQAISRIYFRPGSVI